MSNIRINDYDRFAEKFKALSNPNRLKIFSRLMSCCDSSTPCDENETCACVGELSKDLQIAASTVSHHIKELKNAGLIKLERSGQTILCRIEPSILDEFLQFFKISANI
jgi:ArsR family transcriptional regulator, arsenate/arsenite/antimonite-responsive transcriptional repressor